MTRLLMEVCSGKFYERRRAPTEARIPRLM
jgi:hypothetical protein